MQTTSKAELSLLKRQFRISDLCAIYVAGGDRMVQRDAYPGDNLAVQPIKCGVTGALVDSISAPLDSASPLWEQRVMFRLWVHTKARQQILLGCIEDWLLTNCVKLRHGWHGSYELWSADDLEAELTDVAIDNLIEVRDECSARDWLIQKARACAIEAGRV